MAKLQVYRVKDNGEGNNGTGLAKVVIGEGARWKCCWKKNVHRLLFGGIAK